MNTDDVKKQAEWELDIEEFEEEVKKEKAKIKNRKSWWENIFPYKITITKQEK